MRERAGSPEDPESILSGAESLQKAAPLPLRSYERSQESVVGMIGKIQRVALRGV